MPNLIAAEPIVPEFLQEQARPERVAEAIAQLCIDGPARARQLEGLEFMAAGLPNREIAEALRISPATVKRRAGVRERAPTVRMARPSARSTTG